VTLRLDESTLREPLRRALAARSARKVPPGAGTAAAVLVPLFERDGEAHVWLARRPKSMRSHAGQVAFPGGKRDAADPSLLDTALRESHEELGIARASVDVLGALDDIFTITGFAVSPWVGWLAPDVELAPNPGEVARVFTAPLRAFLEEPKGIFPWRGWTVDGELVWGATAAIVRGFVAILRELSLDPLDQ
jgi:8-oxo-dGTP pyrophosphatase MutT (NUDIX family)